MVIFMGVAGSGKTLQGRRLADEMGLPWLSTGEFLRMLISGQKRKDMLKGYLFNDQEMIELIQKILAIINKDEEFVLDGFPRTTAQADWLLNQVKHGQLKVSAVIHLQASEEAVEKRLLSRGRQDDTKEAIDERFREYEESARPILEHFKAAGVNVVDIDGEQDVEAVYDQVKQVVQAAL